MNKSFYDSLTELITLDSGVVQKIPVNSFIRGIKHTFNEDVPVYVVANKQFDRVVALLPTYVEQICDKLVSSSDNDEANSQMKSINFTIVNNAQQHTYQVIVVRADNF